MQRTKTMNFVLRSLSVENLDSRQRAGRDSIFGDHTSGNLPADRTEERGKRPSFNSFEYI